MQRLVNARAAALFALSTAWWLSIGCGSSSGDDLTSTGGKAGKAGATTGGSGGSGAIATGGGAGLGSGGSGGVSGTGGSGGSVDAASDSFSDAAGSAATAADGSGASDSGSVDSGLDGALQSTPGMVACLDQQCDLTVTPPSICCLQTSSLYPTMCYPSFPGCIAAGQTIACDEPADCTNGGVCCAARTTLAGYSAGCVPSCSSPGIRLCRQTSDCPGAQTCQPIAALPGYYGCS